MRRLLLGVLAGVLALLTLAPAAGAATTSDASAAKVDRVLIISLPAVSWGDVQAADAPNLKALFAKSAVGAMITRTAGKRSSAAAGYTAIGAGGRASAATPLAAQAFEPDEAYGDTTASEVYHQRTGRRADGQIVHLGIAALKQENAEGLFNPRIGAFGDALAGAGDSRAVIANADGAQPIVDDPLPQYQRAAVNALMTGDGTVPRGLVGRELLEDAPGWPFGVRMNLDVAYDAFADSWARGGVVLVEGSDLLRADLYGDFTTADQLRVQRLAALERFDSLLGRMLADVDPAHDAVMVVGPATSRQGSGLAVASLRAPGIDSGLLRSASSRRTGFVFAYDTAPTALDLLGIPAPKKMEGEVMEARATSGDRITRLVRANTDAVFRDSKVSIATTIVLVLSALLAVVAGLVAQQRLRRIGRRPGLLRGFALAVLGFLAATYLAGPLHFGRSGNQLAYFGFLAVFAVAFAFVCSLAGRRHPHAPLAVALAFTVVLHVADLLAGARLELDTVFGYSATVGIRLSGQGNPTFAQLTAALVLLGGLVVWRRPGRRTVWAVIAMLAFSLLVMAAPPFGGDFGAALAGAPAFGLFAWLLLGRQVRFKTVAILVGLLVGAGLVVGIGDSLRPADKQTHIGRLFGKLLDGDTGDFFLTIRRKLVANLDSFTNTKLLWVLPIVAVLLWVLWRVPQSRARVLFQRVPVIRQTLLAFAVLAFLGYALNDSGVSIPALMAVVLECAVVFVVNVGRPVTAAPQDPEPVPVPDAESVAAGT
ncbi:MAG: hypothetical protein U0W40_15330 [Acidimicrobiia bacterium]